MIVETNSRSKGDRLKAALGVAAFHALLGYALLTGLGIDVADKAGETLKLLDLRRDPATPPAEPDVPPARRDEVAEAPAAPPALKAEPPSIVAPPPEVRLDAASPVIAAPVAGAGSEADRGASHLPGQGTGMAGAGTGIGGGGSGDGSGAGGAVTRARQVRGSLSGRDYPRAAKRIRAAGTVLVRYTVAADGRVRDCTVTQSSGNDDLDRVTCRLIESRFRYEPARDAQGRPVPDTLTGRHIWWTEPRRPTNPAEWQPGNEASD